MPEMNGYEVCGHLNADDRLKGIPVIFISALTEPLDKVKAFATGGVDYITKPFQMEELHARVETHLKLRRLQLELEDDQRATGEGEPQDVAGPGGGGANPKDVPALRGVYRRGHAVRLGLPALRRAGR